jgi:hypothetical protein
MLTRVPMLDWIPRGYVGPAYANRRDVLVTKAGVMIGLLREPPPKMANSAEKFAEDIVMHRGGPFWAVQRMVIELCGAVVKQ